MSDRRWIKVPKRNDCYELEPVAGRSKCMTRINFTQLAFDNDNERLIAIDSKGVLYHVELSSDGLYCQKSGFVGQATLLAFNPINRCEILVGLNTADIKVLRIDADANQFCLLSGHKLPPTYISFYKDYCLTSSSKEVIIWYLKSCSKVHQLHVNARHVLMRKASFSNLGHIVVLYHNDTMQAWTFKELENDTKINAKTYGICNIKDFVFTRNGRAMIVAGSQCKLIVFNTYDWTLIKSLNLSSSLGGVRNLSVVPLPLDGGANKILAIVSSNCSLQFFDIESSSLIEMLQPVDRVKKLTVSSNGRYITYIEIEGCLRIMVSEKLLSQKPSVPQKIKSPQRLHAHKLNDHLECVRSNMKEELRIERLLPILQEFGEYPNKYRALIWSTILELPSNKNAYTAVTNKATDGTLVLDLLKNYSLADRSQMSLLSTTINCLIQWCPLLVQCSFLPNLVFPFLTVFQKDPLLVFEFILSILLNYCQKWFEYHPLPPLNVLGIIENILLEADPVLLNVFCERGITSSEYAWPLLQTMLSEVLSGDEWLILWDHLISFRMPSLLLMCIVAYSICVRDIVMSSVHSSEDIKQLYITQSHIRAKELLKVAQKLDHETPERIHPNFYLRNELITLPAVGPYPSFILQECPKFLTEDFSLSEFKELKEQQRILEENSRRSMQLAEEKRLLRETKAFMECIHQSRLEELKKCFQEYMRLEAVVQEAKKNKLQEYVWNDSSKIVHSRDTPDTLSDKKHRNHNELKRDVEKLENEVQSFLSSIRSSRSGVT